MADLPPGTDLSSLTPSQRSNLIDTVKQQMAVANAQEIIQRLSDKCVKRCIVKPGTSLDSSEKKCIGNCMDRFMDSWNIVSRAYQQRLQEEGGLKSGF